MEPAGSTRRYVPPLPPPRTFRANATVAVLLAGIAGALNAGGFFAVGVYTSHVTGAWSRMGDELALGHVVEAAKFMAFVASFIAGAFTATFLIEHDTSGIRRVRYLKPLVLEIVLLAAFVVLGVATASSKWLTPYLTMVLCFTMGLQNAMVTKISGAVVRTTHMTGIATDLGIELARLSLFVRDRGRARADRRETLGLLRVEGQKAALHLWILVAFAAGATGGAVSFLRFGYLGAAPIALVLASLVAFELWTIRRGPEGAAGMLTGPATLRLGDRARLVAEAPPLPVEPEPARLAASPAPPQAAAPPGASREPAARRFATAQLQKLIEAGDAGAPPAPPS